MKCKLSAAAIALLLPVAGESRATITFFGVDLTTNDGWRTSSVGKPDADGDNIYGTDGYYIAQYANGDPNNSSQPGWGTIDLLNGAYEGVGAEAHQSAFDDVLGAGPGPVADLVAGDYWVDNIGPTGTETDFFSITLNQSVSFRLGVITDQTPDNPAGLLWEASRAVRVTGPGGQDSGVIDAVGPGEAWRNADVDYVLFDITGDAGDVFTVWGVQDDRWTANALGGVFVDTIPEPSVSLLASLGLAGILPRRRR